LYQPIRCKVSDVKVDGARITFQSHCITKGSDASDEEEVLTVDGPDRIRLSYPLGRYMTEHYILCKRCTPICAADAVTRSQLTGTRLNPCAFSCACR
jgi:hypothetical protein